MISSQSQKVQTKGHAHEPGNETGGKKSKENTLIIEMSLRGRPELTSSRFA